MDRIDIVIYLQCDRGSTNKEPSVILTSQFCHRSGKFSRALHRLFMYTVFALSFDWFSGLSVYCVIGQFGFFEYLVPLYQNKPPSKTFHMEIVFDLDEK